MPDTARHYGHVLMAIVFFFLAQLLTCAWDQPFWEYDIDFPGQIVAMVFVWLFLWAAQLAFFGPGKGLEWVYHRHLKAPVSLDVLVMLTLTLENYLGKCIDTYDVME